MKHWADLTWTDVQALLDAQTAERPLIAILPAGATEAHGPHLPLAPTIAPPRRKRCLGRSLRAR